MLICCGTNSQGTYIRKDLSGKYRATLSRTSSWGKLKRNIKEVATKVLGTRKIMWKKKYATKHLGFAMKLRSNAREKKTAFLKYNTTKTSENYQEYKRIRNITNNLVR